MGEKPIHTVVNTTIAGMINRRNKDTHITCFIYFLVDTMLKDAPSKKRAKGVATCESDLIPDIIIKGILIPVIFSITAAIVVSIMGFLRTLSINSLMLTFSPLKYSRATMEYVLKDITAKTITIDMGPRYSAPIKDTRTGKPKYTSFPRISAWIMTPHRLLTFSNRGTKTIPAKKIKVVPITEYSIKATLKAFARSVSYTLTKSIEGRKIQNNSRLVAPTTLSFIKPALLVMYPMSITINKGVTTFKPNSITLNNLPPDRIIINFPEHMKNYNMDHMKA